MNLSTSDRETLAKLLGLTGSEHDGEALSAARKADALIRARGATWRDVLLVRPPTSSPTPSTWRGRGGPPHAAQVMDVLRRGGGNITQWERGFLLNILSYRKLRHRQADILASIARKVAAAEYSI